MRISVLGTGYVGLVAGTCFAESGNEVTCVDIDAKKIEHLNLGEVPIYEPGLGELMNRNQKNYRLSFTTDAPSAIRNSEIIFIAVGTPSHPDGSVDLDLFMKAAQTISENLNDYKIIVNKSTVPVGTAATIEKFIKSKTKAPFDLVSNPEFLKEGTAIDDFLKPDRIIIGTSKESVYKIMAQLYSPFVRQGNPILWMDNLSAEMTKYASNAFLATKISFINEVANLCELVGADIESVRKGISTDNRIGKRFLYAGVGYGGSCFPKDVKALIRTGKEHGIKMEIVHAAEEINERQKERLFHKMEKHFDKQLKGKTIALWGLSFKPNTDDMREAPSLVLIQKLLNAGVKVRVFDPVAMEESKKYLSENKGIQYAITLYGALEGADALALVTEWNEFRNPDFQKIKTLLKNPVIFDGRNLYDPAIMKDLGFLYYGIGRALL